MRSPDDGAIANLRANKGDVQLALGGYRISLESSSDYSKGFIGFGSNMLIVLRPGKITRDDHANIFMGLTGSDRGAINVIRMYGVQHLMLKGGENEYT